jgi:hypothetical protein
MKLKNKNLAPVGGFYWKYEIKREGITFPAIVYGSTWNSLLQNVQKDYRSNGADIPSNISEMIEDQICQRQPSDRCWYRDGIGDKIAQAIHKVASVTDRVLGTKLEHKARGCSSCNKRRNTLNSLSVPIK